MVQLFGKSCCYIEIYWGFDRVVIEKLHFEAFQMR